ncbi:serine/threonine-protein kinase [Archangium sp.]|jgi:serine/threonine protein kinase|uniref:serine/threonine-protein kinase n=1 Tax=Archangium sp. TaxID=1872627 RepID=UPI002EDA6AAB
MTDASRTPPVDASSEPASNPSTPFQITPGMVLKETYRIEAQLGSGGMGTVYRATHLQLDKLMAVKVLNSRLFGTPETLARFEREAKVAAKISHPVMTHVVDFGVVRGTPFIVMEYVTGTELAELLAKQGALPPRTAVAVMRQLLSLLRTAHALGIVHRDLKPANLKVLLSAPDDTQLFVKVLDFGIAKQLDESVTQLTSDGALVGTPAYMAPEQIAEKPVDARTDLYAAGLIFHEMLSGKRAFAGKTIPRILHAQMTEPPPPIELPLPDVVRRTLAKLVEKRPEDRFQDAAEADRAFAACEEALRPGVGVSSLAAPVDMPHPSPDDGPADDGRSATLPPDKVQKEQRAADPKKPEPQPEVRQQREPERPAPKTPEPPPRPRSSGAMRVVAIAAGVVLGIPLLLFIGVFIVTLVKQIVGAPDAPRPATTASSTPTAGSANDTEVAATEPTLAPDPDEGPDTESAEDEDAPLDEPGCYVMEVSVESTRGEDGRYGPWMEAEKLTRSPVSCEGLTQQPLDPFIQALFVNYDDEQLLQGETLSFEEQKQDQPDVRSKRVRVYSRVPKATANADVP